MCDTDGQPQAGPPVEYQLHEAYYRQLVRLAALLTGNPDAAEKVACDALAALPRLPNRMRGEPPDRLAPGRHKTVHAGVHPGSRPSQPARRS